MSSIDIRHPLIVCKASAGTGKTFTLAAYYIAMLFSGESYRNILAVTFTKAATTEMKERILTYLLGIADGGEQDFLRKVREYMLRDSEVSDQVLRSRAAANLHAILQDYDNFSVTTIDSFLQQLISGLAVAINRTADFAISLDVDQVIASAVDTMLTSELTDESKRTVFEYVEQCIGDSESWDIRKSLIRIATQLYKESVQVYSTRLSADVRLDLDAKRIADYRSALYRQRNAALAKFVQITQRAKSDQEAGVAYTQGRNAKTLIDNMCKCATDTQAVKSSELFRGASDKGLAEVLADPSLAELQRACDDMRHTWWQTTCSMTYLNDMRLMRALEESIQRQLQRTNTALLADTAVTLAEALQPGDADFILEKAGIRYRHIMIDEFQDTSLLQWNVFLHLIKEVVAVPGQTVLIVGDAKQSIYRFRNGNWQIMERLGKSELCEVFNPDVEPLVRNQRSRERVVRFNLGVMQHVAKQDNLQMPVSDTDRRPVGPTLYDEHQAERPLSEFYRTDKHQDGYVRCRFYPFYDKKSAKSVGTESLLKELQQQALWSDVCSTIEQLLAAGERPQDILVLGRYNSEIQKWAAFCREQGDTYPLLNRTQMVSRDSFKLESCITVQLLITALRYMHTGSSAAAAYLRLYLGEDITERIKAVDSRSPLYDRLQHLLQVIGCADGIYQGEDVAYVNSLLDEVQNFIATNGSDVQALLQYWDDKMSTFAIAGSSSEAIQLMTVHNSKGLEGKTVILLNAAWETEKDHKEAVLWAPAIPIADCSLPYIPVRQEANLQRTGEHSAFNIAYTREHEAQRVDNYNLLYVALTRAADNLLVYALPNAKSHLDGYPTVAASLLDYCGLRDRLKTFAESEDTCLEYTAGDAPYIHQPDEHKSGSPFSYAGAEPVATVICSDGEQITFRQSQESAQYTQDGDSADELTAQTDFGLLCHDIFAHIGSYSEVEQVLDSYRQQGLIEDNDQYNRIAELIREAFTSSLMQQWFDGTWQLKREEAILTPTAVIRPDRVMIKGSKAVVLDYKFTTQQRPGHILQVRDYMSALRRMNYTDVEGWLWYAFGNKLVKVES